MLNYKKKHMCNPYDPTEVKSSEKYSTIPFVPTIPNRGISKIKSDGLDTSTLLKPEVKEKVIETSKKILAGLPDRVIVCGRCPANNTVYSFPIPRRRGRTCLILEDAQLEANNATPYEDLYRIANILLLNMGINIQTPKLFTYDKINPTKPVW